MLPQHFSSAPAPCRRQTQEGKSRTSLPPLSHSVAFGCTPHHALAAVCCFPSLLPLICEVKAWKFGAMLKRLEGFRQGLHQTPHWSPETLPVQIKHQGRRPDHPAIAQRGRILLTFLLCSTTMVVHYFHLLELQAGHRCFSNSECCCSGMNHCVWTMLQHGQFIQQMWSTLGVTWLKLKNA